MDDATFARAQEAFGYCFETPHGSSYPAILDRFELTPFEDSVIEGAGGELRFLPVPVEHGDIKSLGFRFNNIAYLPDVSDILETSKPGFSDLDMLILDCLRRTPHPSHFSLADALAWIEHLTPQKAILTNLHNDLDYKILSAELPETIEPAYDGMLLSVEDTGTGKESALTTDGW